MTHELWFQLGLIGAGIASINAGYFASKYGIKYNKPGISEQEKKKLASNVFGTCIGGMLVAIISYVAGPMGILFWVGSLSMDVIHLFKGDKT